MLQRLTRSARRAPPAWRTPCRTRLRSRLSHSACESFRFLRYKVLRGLERLRGRHLDVGSYTRAFPVCFGDRIDRAREGHTDRELVIDLRRACRMCATAGLLTHDRGALERLQVVRELFGS